ncbi:hypothetical protein [Flavobacterium branchiophilum]|uniref:Lipoprotein n=1 Tax=Flavobacterium branchiophilum TaxID=55197 RepID=A0A543G1Y9_9FLAO|nr:hypothetical protein [Flavobacterium branchiophilum]TQM40120.1 hypothetical protein BC670_0987 [Flavobacterium branchiophilum]
MKKLKTVALVLLITLFSCTEENNYYTTAERLGKENIYIEGNITNEEAQAQLTDELGKNTQNIYVQNTTQLTAINIHSDTNIRHIEFENNQDLVNITIGGFKKIKELLFKNEGTFPLPLTPKNIKCNDIEEASYLDIRLPYQAPGHNVSFNKLKKVGPNDFTLLAECNELNFPTLETVNVFNFAVKKPIITFPVLKHIETINGPSYIEFNQLNFPALQYCKKFNFSTWEWTQSTIITIPLLQYCEFFRLLNAINDSNITNTILHQFITVFPVSGKQIEIGGGQPPAPPTGQGIIDKQTLINQGNAVYTN